MAVPAFRAAGTTVFGANSAANPTTLSPVKNAATVNGDMMVLITVCRAIAPTCATPSGWTPLNGFPVQAAAANGGKIYVFTRPADGSASDAPSVVWSGITTGTTGDSTDAVILSYQNTSAVRDAISSLTETTAVTTSSTIPSLTTLTANALVIGIAVKLQDGAVTSTVTNLTERVDATTTNASGQQLEVSDKVVTSPGASNTATVTWSSGTSARGLTIAFALQPIPTPLDTDVRAVQTSSSNSTTHSATPPASRLPGDYLVMIGYITAAVAVTVPTGWVEIIPQKTEVTDAMRGFCFGRKADLGADDTPTLTWDGSTVFTDVVVAAIKNVDITNPIAAASSAMADQTAGLTTLSCDSQTANEDGELALNFGIANSGDSATPATGWLEDSDVAFFPKLFHKNALLANAGTSGATSHTWSAGNPCLTGTILIRPLVTNLGSNKDTASATTLTLATTQAVPSGGRVVVEVSAQSSGSVTLSGGGLTWTTDKTFTQGTTLVAICSAPAPSGLASGTTLTATYSVASTDRILSAGCVKNVGTPTSSNSAGATSGTTFSSGNVTAAANDLVLGASRYSAASGSATSAPSGNNTELFDDTLADGESMTAVYQLGTGAAVAATGTWSATIVAAATVVVLYPYSTGGATLTQSISDTASLSDSVSLGTGKVLADNPTLADAVTPAAGKAQSIADTPALADSISKGLNKVIAESSGAVGVQYGINAAWAFSNGPVVAPEGWTLLHELAAGKPLLLRGVYPYPSASFDQAASEGWSVIPVLDGYWDSGRPSTAADYLSLVQDWFASSVASHSAFAGAVELTNEPFWNAVSPSTYMSYVGSAIDWLIANHPTVKIYLPIDDWQTAHGSSPGMASWIDAMFTARATLASDVYGFALHPYTPTATDADDTTAGAESVINDLTITNARLAAHSATNLKILCSEFGWATNGTAGQDFVTEAVQNTRYGKAITIFNDPANNVVGAQAFQALDSSPSATADDWQNHFGIWKYVGAGTGDWNDPANWTTKAAHDALKTAIAAQGSGGGLALNDSILGQTGKGASINDSASLADAIVKGVGKGLADNPILADALTFSVMKGLADAPALADAISLEVGKVLTDNPALADAITPSRGVSQSISDSPTLADALSLAVGKVLADAATPADAVSLEPGKVLSDAAGVADSVQEATGKGVSLTDTAGLADAIALGVSTALTDAAGVVDAVTITSMYQRILADAAAVSDGRAFDLGHVVTDAAPLADLVVASRGVDALLADSVVLTDNVARQAGYGRTIADPVDLDDTVTPETAGQGEIHLSDVVALADDVEGATTFHRVMIDAVPVADAAAAATAWHRLANDAISVSDTLLFENRFAREIDEHLVLIDTVVPQTEYKRVLADIATVADVVSWHLRFVQEVVHIRDYPVGGVLAVASDRQYTSVELDDRTVVRLTILARKKEV